MLRLQAACEKAKIDLSKLAETSLSIDFLWPGQAAWEGRITRQQFELINEDFFRQCLRQTSKSLRDAGLDVDSVDDVVLVGGSTRIPKASSSLSPPIVLHFHKAAHACSRLSMLGSMTLTGVIIKQACQHLEAHHINRCRLQLSIKCGQKPCIRMGVLRPMYQILMEAPVMLLQIKALLSDMFGVRKICDSVNPDEVVSYGAAVQASILSGASEKLLVDVTNFSLGTNTKGDVMVRQNPSLSPFLLFIVFRRNTAKPTAESLTMIDGYDGKMITIL